MNGSEWASLGAHFLLPGLDICWAYFRAMHMMFLLLILGSNLPLEQPLWFGDRQRRWQIVLVLKAVCPDYNRSLVTVFSRDQFAYPASDNNKVGIEMQNDGLLLQCFWRPDLWVFNSSFNKTLFLMAHEHCEKATQINVHQIGWSNSWTKIGKYCLCRWIFRVNQKKKCAVERW